MCNVRLALVGGLVLVFSLPWAGAQESKEMWDQMIDAVAAGSVVQVQLTQAGEPKKLAKKYAAQMAQLAKDFEVLENPGCRCLPSPQGLLILTMSEHRLLVVEIVKGHWFRAYFYEPEQGFQRVLLQDKGDKLYKLLEAELTPPPAEEEPMCDECQGKMVIMMIGECSACGNSTPSAAYRFCADCARAKKVCQSCGEPLKK